MRSEHTDLRQSRTLPSISEHLVRAAARKAGDEAKAERWRRKAIQDCCSDLDQEAEARHQAQLEQRHLEAYRNMHRLQDALCRRYTALLKDKVLSQRSELQQRSETARGKSESEAKQRQKKLAFSKLQHNDSYLESLPKTSYYLIFDLQKQLAERGCLKTHRDLEDFYRCIKYNRHPSELHKSLEDVRNKMLERRCAADVMTQFKTSEKRPCSAEDTRYKDQVSHSRLLELTSGSGEKSAEQIFSGRQEKEEPEQVIPKMKAPTFATLQPDFMRNFQSKMPDLIIPEIPRRNRRAEIYMSRLRRMHDLCLTNMAFSRRLLDRETDSPCWQEERGDQDLMLPGTDSKHERMKRTNQPPLRPPTQAKRVQNEQPPCPQLSRMTAASFEPRVWDTAACFHKTPDPLSMEDVCQQKHVVVIDRGPKLWRNCMEN